MGRALTWSPSQKSGERKPLSETFVGNLCRKPLSNRRFLDKGRDEGSDEAPEGRHDNSRAKERSDCRPGYRAPIGHPSPQTAATARQRGESDWGEGKGWGATCDPVSREPSTATVRSIPRLPP